ncbi:GDSL-type esterase/lipase family protein [Olivibacter sp. XZL3]|uniref:SGNH/GDSL hydrolase family protein n=1 Tax=Olivibacter sp. XZL3 TaxID=1735116 RepID=UPI0010660E7A|nr:GDSL-type esterase/lipase family protein [Olivibacter sp. XZL3]
MKTARYIVYSLFLFSVSWAQETDRISPVGYLDSVKHMLHAKFPKNRTINLVFHGHSVPSGYWANSEVHTLQSYPYLLLKKLKAQYPYAVINVILTSIGGEWAEKGEKRFATDVLPHKPDVLFIDYALNDMGVGLARSKIAWSKMIEAAKEKGIKVVLLTPSPDQRQNLIDPNCQLAQHAQQIRTLARQYHIGLADPYQRFVQIATKEDSLKEYMSHVNHPNEAGHQVIADELFKWFQ